MSKRFFLVCTTKGIIRLAHHMMVEEDIETASILLALLVCGDKFPEYTEVLLPSGAKVRELANPGMRKKGKYIISGYAYDSGDIARYLSFGKKQSY